MGVFKEFKDFATRGNVIDLAVGVVIGVAFGKIITSLVNDIIMPPIGMFLGNADFSNLFFDLSGKGYATLSAAKTAGAPVIAYGNFINVVIEFTIIALAIFMVVRQINKMKKEIAAAGPSEEVLLLREIRDEIKGRRK